MRPLVLLVPLFASCVASLNDPKDLSGCSSPRPDTYLERARLLDGSWAYRRTIIEGGGPFLGLTDVRRFDWELRGDELLARSEAGVTLAAFDARLVDAVCSQGQWIESVDAPASERLLLAVDWASRRGAEPLQHQGLRFEISAERGPELAGLRQRYPGHVDLTEEAELSGPPEACAAFDVRYAPPQRCGGRARMRHVFSDAEVEHPGPRVYYLTVGAPSAPTGEVAAQFQAVVPGFEIRENDCSAAGLSRALAARPTLAGLVPSPPGGMSEEALRAVCSAVERAAPELFHWQRPGDLRYSTIAWDPAPAPRGWGSYAAMALVLGEAEPRAADLFVDASYVERSVERVVRAVTGPDPAPAALLALAEARARSLLSQRYALRSEARARIRAGASAALSPEAVLQRYEGLGATQDTALANDGLEATVLMGPSYASGDPIPPEIGALAAPRARLELMVARHNGEIAARLLSSGYDAIDRLGPSGIEGAALDFLELPAAETRLMVHQRLSVHLLLHGLGHTLGLADNPAGSSDVLNYPREYFDGDRRAAGASVMDVLGAEHQLWATRLGSSDLAELRGLYADQVEVYSSPVSLPHFASASQLRGAALMDRRFVPRAEADPALLVPHAACDVRTALLLPTPSCAVGDFGGGPREVFADKYARWLGRYHFTNLVLDPDSFDPLAAIRPAIEVIQAASIAGQWLAYWETAEPGFEGTAAEQELFDVVNLGVNFGAELMAMPEPGRNCWWPQSAPPVYLPGYYFPQQCDPGADLEAELSAERGMIDVLPGLGRPRTVERDAPDGPWRSLGAEIDRQSFLLGVTFPFPTALPGGAPRATVDRLVPATRELILRVLSADAELVSLSNATASGDYWCFDAGLERPSAGHLEWRRAVSEDGAIFPGPSAACSTPAVFHPPQSRGLSAAALVSWFVGLEEGMPLYRLGADDQEVDWTTYGPEATCSGEAFDGSRYGAIGAPGSPQCLFLERLSGWTEARRADLHNSTYRRAHDNQLALIDLARALRGRYAP